MRFNVQLGHLNSKEFGAEGEDYLLFDGLRRNTLSIALSEIYSKLGCKYKPKSQRCSRQTFSTKFVGLTCGDFFLVRRSWAIKMWRRLCVSSYI
ncbi:MAG: hypothetical protein KDD50_03290 [Bdellovibrionales bacterium]|nr:hypothetical protein [Bdellovibrionales bacterium]